jgi:hypothetical protein
MVLTPSAHERNNNKLILILILILKIYFFFLFLFLLPQMINQSISFFMFLLHMKETNEAVQQTEQH